MHSVEPAAEGAVNVRSKSESDTSYHMMYRFISLSVECDMSGVPHPCVAVQYINYGSAQ